MGPGPFSPTALVSRTERGLLTRPFPAALASEDSQGHQGPVTAERVCTPHTLFREAATRPAVAGGQTANAMISLGSPPLEAPFGDFSTVPRRPAVAGCFHMSVTHGSWEPSNAREPRPRREGAWAKVTQLGSSA